MKLVRLRQKVRNFKIIVIKYYRNNCYICDDDNNIKYGYVVLIQRSN